MESKQLSLDNRIREQKRRVKVTHSHSDRMILLYMIMKKALGSVNK